MEKLFSLLNAIAPLSPGLTELLQTAVESTSFPKGDYILREGKVCQHIYFLESGLVRIFNRLAEKGSNLLVSKGKRLLHLRLQLLQTTALL